MLDKSKGKSGLGVLIALSKKKAGVSDDGDKGLDSSESPDSAPDKGRIASDELFDAIQSGDKDAFYSALKSACEAIDSDSGMGESDSEGEAV